jgi:hypothetical protein
LLISKTDSKRVGRALAALQSAFRDVLGLDGCWLAVTAPGAGLIKKLAGLYGLIAGEGLPSMQAFQITSIDKPFTLWDRLPQIIPRIRG